MFTMSGPEPVVNMPDFRHWSAISASRGRILPEFVPIFSLLFNEAS
jgi:hypothetical protein